MKIALNCLYKLPTYLALSPVYFYIYLISPLLPSRCRFYPTCSSYCALSIRNYGILKGILLGLKRILKCNPLHPGGIDFPPQKTKE